MNEIQELKNAIKEQDKQILSLKKAIDTLMHRLKDTDARARRSSEADRRTANEINTIKRNMEMIKRKLGI